MKRIFLTAAAVFSLLQSYSQNQPDTGYRSRKLRMEEMNLVSSYYSQNGDHAAVTGGIGTEKLTDIANVFDIKLVRYDKRKRKQVFDFEMGFDRYTSASSDMIDLKANSSASHGDGRFYPSVVLNIEDEKKGITKGIGISSSTESDYQSWGLNLLYSKKFKENGSEISAKLQGFFDNLKLIEPIELRTVNYSFSSYPRTQRNTLSLALSYSRIINENFQVIFLADAVMQDGYLSLPFHRVYFMDGSVHQENLPDKRYKFPVGIRGSYFLGDKLILRGYYRFYYDDWGLKSHTAELETPIKLTPFLSLSPFCRFYRQSGIDYFRPYKETVPDDKFYTSNHDLSSFSSYFAGAGIRIAPPNGIFKRIAMVEVRYGHYRRDSPLNADIISLHLKYK